VATLYHYLLGLPAPYAWTRLPKLLGIPGGIGLVVGTLGLMREKARRDPGMVDRKTAAMDWAFVTMLFATGLSGLLLMLLRQTPAMGVSLSVHLGVVFALFLSLPYSKFVHGLYRFAALARYGAERRNV
jgi:citrate/tricarballylate utilization protein